MSKSVFNLASPIKNLNHTLQESPRQNEAEYKGAPAAKTNLWTKPVSLFSHVLINEVASKVGEVGFGGVITTCDWGLGGGEGEGGAHLTDATLCLV